MCVLLTFPGSSLCVQVVNIYVLLDHFPRNYTSWTSPSKFSNLLTVRIQFGILECNFLKNLPILKFIQRIGHSLKKNIIDLKDCYRRRNRQLKSVHETHPTYAICRNNSCQTLHLNVVIAKTRCNSVTFRNSFVHIMELDHLYRHGVTKQPLNNLHC